MSSLELITSFVLKNVKRNDICNGCLRGAKSQKSHGNYCIMEFLALFFAENATKIATYVNTKSKDAYFACDDLQKPTTIFLVAQKIVADGGVDEGDVSAHS